MKTLNLVVVVLVAILVAFVSFDAPVAEATQDDVATLYLSFQDWDVMGNLASPRLATALFGVRKEDGICTLLVVPPTGVNRALHVFNFEWSNGISENYEMAVHWDDFIDADFYALYDLPQISSYSMLINRIRSMNSVSINGGPRISLIGSSTALDALGC